MKQVGVCVVSPGVLALVVALTVRSHVCIGVTPGETYRVTANAVEVCIAAADTNGILCFEFDDAPFVPGPITVGLMVDDVDSGVESLTMMRTPEDAVRWAWCVAPVWQRWGLW